MHHGKINHNMECAKDLSYLIIIFTVMMVFTWGAMFAPNKLG